jgi:hypothetical protein
MSSLASAGGAEDHQRGSASRAEVVSKNKKEGGEKAKQGDGPSGIKYVNNRVVNEDGGLFAVAERIYEKCTFIFTFIPFFGNAFKWHEPSVKNGDNESKFVLKPGFLTLRSIYDGASFQWLRYLEVIPSLNFLFAYMYIFFLN